MGAGTVADDFELVGTLREPGHRPFATTVTGAAVVAADVTIGSPSPARRPSRA